MSKQLALKPSEGGATNQPSFRTFFHTATGNPPYGYQSRLAENDPGTACRSQLINIPTGLGKTAPCLRA